MKQLQNNFTTPEQSKRLLELGVPADSSDCYYTQEEIEGYMYWFDLHIKREYQPHTSLHASTIWGKTLPAWSVGQLIDIYCTCLECTWEYITNNPPIEDILCDIELCIGEMDFSKLEE